MQQFFGLLLIIAVISLLFYVSGHPELIRIQIPIPRVSPISTPQYSGTNSNTSSNTTSIQSAPKEPLSVSLIRPQTPGGYGEIVLRADWNIGNSGMDIKDWRIGALETEYYLTGAQNIYTFGGSVDKLMIFPGDEIRIFSGQSPKGNFRINKCIGYIAEYNAFNPPIPQRCPAYSYEETSYLSTACRSYLSSLRSCEVPRQAPPVPFNDQACHSFVNNINYETCVARHRNDSDFLDNEIWVWAGDGLKYFDRAGDIIRIYDRSGTLVSQYRY